MMSSYLSIRLLALVLFVTLFFIYSSGHGHSYDPHKGKANMTHHGGLILNGTVNLAIMWYGEVAVDIQKNVRDFIKSLESGGKDNPKVSTWWEMVESYQAMAPNALPGVPKKIKVSLAKESYEKQCKLGKVLTLQAHIPELIQHATQGDHSLLPVVIAAKDITVQGLCYGKCYDHCVTDDGKNRPYIVVADLETECPGECLWPFAPSDSVPGPVLKPPSGSATAHAVVASLAGALVDTITNPMNNGIFHENQADSLGPAAVCKGIFGPGAAPGNPGKVLTDPVTHGNYNANGNNAEKYLLPAIWNPKTKACWTVA